MKELKINYSVSLSFYSLCLVAFTLPLNMKINTIAIILAVLINLVEVFREKKFNLLIPTKNSIFFLAYYFIIIATLVYSVNITEGIKKLEYNLSFLVMPIFLHKIKSLNKNQFQSILKTFVISMLLTNIFLIIIAFIRYLPERNANVFFYQSFTSVLDFHPVYYSIYIVLSIMILIFGLNDHNFRRQIFLVLFFLLILILLSSKSIIIACLIFLLVFLFKKIKTMDSIFVSIIICSFLLIFGNKYLKNRFSEISNIENLSILKENSMTDLSKVNGLTLRLMFIKYAVLESIDNPMIFIFGQGYGDKQIFLNSVYEKRNMAITIDGKKIGYYNYNTHNQYIETFVCAGIIGLCYLLFFFFILIKKSSTNKIAIGFYSLLLWSFFFESVLMVNKGIVLFVFWGLIFMNNDIDRDWYNWEKDSSQSKFG